ncbi:MAG: single-stranded DNA-binding protein [Gammaproteobacteria bacterium]|nr:single-stranded DNA-binding protein [Gammaproteobacteria bacterium]MYK44950.1 single-stranded DNA-binding protein [Gammaproteobacteria bacterium]
MAGGSINKVILIGNLGADPEMRYTQDQNAVANFRIATSERWTDRATNERRERTEWHRIVCFRRLAEICGEYLHKGSKVYIEGQLQTRSWEGQDGQTRYTTEVVARDMQMLDSRGGGGGFGGPDEGGGYGDRGGQHDRGGYGGDQPRRSAPPASSQQPPKDEPDDFEDDIPF